MLSRCKDQNSWVVSLQRDNITTHHYMCQCAYTFTLQIQRDEAEKFPVVCPMCGNDYFLDSEAFTANNGVIVYKCFQWETEEYQTEDSWCITRFITIPKVSGSGGRVRWVKERLMTVKLNKDGSKEPTIHKYSHIASKYYLVQENRVVPLHKVLRIGIKERLYRYILKHPTETIMWFNKSKIATFSIKEKLRYVQFFLAHPMFQWHSFFFWKMEGVCLDFPKPVTPKEALHSITNGRKEKILRKNLYQGYADMMQQTGYYYPYSDYVFSRTIDNVDLLAKLFLLPPAIKQALFEADTYSTAMVLIRFLKRYYSQKQIVKLFVHDIQDDTSQDSNMRLFEDCLRMLQVRRDINTFEREFTKVKLTVQNLHDEIVRVYQIRSYRKATKEKFDYEPIYLSACQHYGGLEFRLPLTVRELDAWSKTLHNCMFSYAKRIHQRQAIIYGIFQEGELKYAIELRCFKVVQAKGIANAVLSETVMEIIGGWESQYFGIYR